MPLSSPLRRSEGTPLTAGSTAPPPPPPTCRARSGVASRPRLTSLASHTRCGRPGRGSVIIGLLARMGMPPGPMRPHAPTPTSAWLALGSASQTRFPDDPPILCRASTAGAARPLTCTVRCTSAMGCSQCAARNPPNHCRPICPVHTAERQPWAPRLPTRPLPSPPGFVGPTIRVKQGMRVTVNFKNNIPLPTKNSSREPA